MEFHFGQHLCPIARCDVSLSDTSSDRLKAISGLAMCQINLLTKGFQNWLRPCAMDAKALGSSNLCIWKQGFGSSLKWRVCGRANIRKIEI
jgi:hypothetical protein